MTVQTNSSFLSPPELWGRTVESLWCLGDCSLLDWPTVSIVGTRDLSPGGETRARKITTLLVQAGCCIVSGLAAGVDTVAHETALSLGGKTIAVMGTPIDECYPKENRDLKRRIVESGLVLSQFRPGSKFNRGNFPQRNGLMAAISAVTFVVEAQIDSGTRHQVKAAIALGKKVAFLSSLVNLNFPWVVEAIHSGHGVSIQEPSDALGLLTLLGIVKPKKSQVCGSENFVRRPKSELDVEPFLLEPTPTGHVRHRKVAKHSPIEGLPMGVNRENKL